MKKRLGLFNCGKSSFVLQWDCVSDVATSGSCSHLKTKLISSPHWTRMNRLLFMSPMKREYNGLAGDTHVRPLQGKSPDSWANSIPRHGAGGRRNPGQNGKHFQTLFTTVTVTKSSLEKKNASFSLSLKTEQTEVTGGSSHNRQCHWNTRIFFFNTIS